MKDIMKAKVTIKNVVDWKEDKITEEGDASRVGEARVRLNVANEIHNKIFSRKWYEDNLPVTFLTNLIIDPYYGTRMNAEKAAIEHLNSDLCVFDYYKPTEVEVEYEFVNEKGE